jgi:hypothetical protein
MIPFPELPPYSEKAWDSLNLFRTSPMRELIETFTPFAYFNLPTLTGKSSSELLHTFNALFQEFLISLSTENARPWPDYVRELCEEGGVSNIYFPDGFMHDYSKMFYLFHQKDDNIMCYTGVMIRNHMDQNSKTYGVLRVAQAFMSFLREKQIQFRLFLRTIDSHEDTEVIVS